MHQAAAGMAFANPASKQEHALIVVLQFLLAETECANTAKTQRLAHVIAPHRAVGTAFARFKNNQEFVRTVSTEQHAEMEFVTTMKLL